MIFCFVSSLSIPLKSVCEECSPVRHEHVILAFEAWLGKGLVIPGGIFFRMQMGEVMESEASIRHAVRLLPSAPVSL